MHFFFWLLCVCVSFEINEVIMKCFLSLVKISFVFLVRLIVIKAFAVKALKQMHFGANYFAKA